MIKEIMEDARNILSKDKSAKSLIEVILLYPGLHAVIFHRLSHYLYNKKLYFLARFISQTVKMFTGIEIHPGAKIGRRLFIDHGDGVVIGETAEVGDDCTIYHQVTLGMTGNEKEFKRHPTIKNNVMLGAGCKILGPVVIGDYVKVGALAIITTNVKDKCTIILVNKKINSNAT